jgi:hypothetical protein
MPIIIGPPIIGPPGLGPIPGGGPVVVPPCSVLCPHPAATNPTTTAVASPAATRLPRTLIMPLSHG